MSTVLKVEGMSCGHCENRVKNALEELGVEIIKVSASEDMVEINEKGVSLDKIKEAIEDVGYDVV
ncbi:MAG: cation transporter [Firmicutes bacterium]|jgi:copper chaperone|nr:cation transporter [Bacillota bacterium]